MEDCGRKVLFNHPQSRAQARGSHTQHYSDTLPCCTPSPQSARLLRTPSPAHRILFSARRSTRVAASPSMPTPIARGKEQSIRVPQSAQRNAESRTQNSETIFWFVILIQSRVTCVSVRHLHADPCQVVQPGLGAPRGSRCVSPPPQAAGDHLHARPR